MKPETARWFFFGVMSAVSVVLGFANWTLFLIAAFVGGFAARKMKITERPALLSAAGTAFGWVVLALFRDAFQWGRLSDKLAGFLSLPHALFIYPVLFLLCAVPSFFAALSGSAVESATSRLQEDTLED